MAINHIRKDFGYSGKMDLIGRSESAAVESVEIFKIKSDDFRSFDEMIKSQSVPASETEEIRRAKKGLNLAHVSDGILIGSKLLGVIRKESYTIVVLKKDDFYFIFYLSGV